jgi:hypothetical protein
MDQVSAAAKRPVIVCGSGVPAVESVTSQSPQDLSILTASNSCEEHNLTRIATCSGKEVSNGATNLQAIHVQE